MPDHTYKIIELVGSSRDGVEAAIENAIGRANETLRNLDWFKVNEIRGNIEEGKVGWYQVTISLGFRVLSAEDIHREA